MQRLLPEPAENVRILIVHVYFSAARPGSVIRAGGEVGLIRDNMGLTTTQTMV